MGMNLYKVEVLESGAKKPSFVFTQAEDFSKIESKILNIKMKGTSTLKKYTEVLSIIRVSKKEGFIQ